MQHDNEPCVIGVLLNITPGNTKWRIHLAKIWYRINSWLVNEKCKWINVHSFMITSWHGTIYRCAGNHWLPIDCQRWIPRTKGPVMRTSDVVFYVGLNKLSMGDKYYWNRSSHVNSKTCILDFILTLDVEEVLIFHVSVSCLALWNDKIVNTFKCFINKFSTERATVSVFVLGLINGNADNDPLYAGYCVPSLKYG